MENTEIKHKLVEDTTGAEAPNIASTDSILSVREMFEQALLHSLGREIFPVIPTIGPTAGLFNIRKNASSNKFELVRNDVEVYPSTSINTGLTREVVQDIQSQYGKEATKVIGTLLRGLANAQENTKTLEFLESKSKAYTDLTLSDSLNAEVNLFEITQRAHELILKMNNKNTRTYGAYVVVPAIPLGGLMGLPAYVDNKEDIGHDLFITQIGKTRFYLNPDSTSTKAYVGLVDFTNPSKSAAIFSPYVSTIVEATDPDTGNDNYFIFNRFAITESPLHVTDDEMMYKFNVTA